MSVLSNPVKTTAPLKNVAALLALVDRLKTRPSHLPGIGVFYGWSGLGKTIAAAHAANVHRAIHVEVKSVWTKKALLTAILTELGVRTMPKAAYEMVDVVAGKLLEGRKVLLVDEADHVIDRGYAETIRDIYESCKCPIVLIGEERLPDKLEKIERLHNRVLDPVPAQPADMDDARALRDLYCDQVRIADDLLAAVVDAVGGAARRICVNLDRIQQAALTQGLDAIDLAGWGDQGFFTGRAPARRRA